MEAFNVGSLRQSGFQPSSWIAAALIGWVMLAAAPCMAQSIDAFIPTGDMTVPRSLHTATRLQDGTVLIAGCSGTTSAEVYDPASHRFTATGSMTAVRCGHSATLLADGRVLIAGGDLSGRQHEPCARLRIPEVAGCLHEPDAPSICR